MAPTTSRAELAALLLIVAAAVGVAAGFRPAPPVSEDTLEKVAASLEMYVDLLPQMPKVLGYSLKHGRPTPTHLTIGMYQKKWKFHRDLPATTVFAFGTSAETATFPGPTIEALQGVPLRVTWENHLPDRHILPWDPTVPVAIPRAGGVPTVVHLHGGVHPPQSDGHANAWFTAGFRERGPTWTTPTYAYPNAQSPGGVLWYHDHALGLTRANLLAGLLGAYVIRNPAAEAPLGLPAGDTLDRVLVLADRSFYPDGSLYMNSTGDNPGVHPQWQPEYFGAAVTVNGKAWPFLPVARRRHRFRILNASNARFFNLSLSNGLPFLVVASDASYLPRPVPVTHLLVAVAEAFDVVVDFSAVSAEAAVELELVNTAPYPYPDGDAPGHLTGKVMKFVVAPPSRVPADGGDRSRVVPAARLPEYVKVGEEEAVKKRYIVMYEYEDETTGSPTHLYINGKRPEDPATETPAAGTTEVWEVINLTQDNHPLHLHLAAFQAVRARGLVGVEEFRRCMGRLNDAARCGVGRHAVGEEVAVPEHERTWKNVVKIAPGFVTTVVVKFMMVDTGRNYPFDATAEPGYVYHCHILDHEDNAMIRPLKLIK
ncbi:unnamed protein product [Urochloa decumbens]|uniref:Uncharacterized protein n=1 Tax=Urochloa decumbens TaxID=240449 RepID=A0ABC8Z300_9POAL